MAGPWQPTGWLRRVPVIHDCRMTGGDAAVARPGPRIFYCQPSLDRIEVVRHGKVRRAKLYYLRKLRGKAARIEERRVDRPKSS